jgi:hypothetical protein
MLKQYVYVYINVGNILNRLHKSLAENKLTYPDAESNVWWHSSLVIINMT